MKLKRLLAFILVVVMCFTLASCKSKESDTKETTKNTEETTEDVVAICSTAGNKELTLSLVEYNYYYISLYNQAVYVSEQYDLSYGAGAGAKYYFDTTVDPAEQAYTGEDASEQIKTWADFFKYSAPERAFLIKELYKASTADAEFKLTEQMQTEIANTIDSAMQIFSERAKEANYPLDKYISKVCGEGLTAELYEELLRRDTIAEYYLSWYQTKLSKDISDEQINKYYEEHEDEFNKDTCATSADVRHLLVQVETSTTDKNGATVNLEEDVIEKNWEDAKVEADKLLTEWKNNGATEDEFIKLVKKHTDDIASAETGGLYEDITSSSSYVPEFLEWSLKPHKKGDTEIVKTDYGYHIMYYVGGDTTPKWISDVKNAIVNEKYNEFFDEMYENVSESIERDEELIDEAAEKLENLISSNIER